MNCTTISFELLSFQRHRCLDEKDDGFSIGSVHIGIGDKLLFGGALLRIDRIWELWDVLYINGIIHAVMNFRAWRLK